MTESQPGWSEENSRFFIDYARYFVPDRESQIRTVCSLVPDPEQPFQVLELSCGAGQLAGALLEQYPQSTISALDRSHEMLEAARQHLAPFGERFELGKFDMESKDWRGTGPVYQAVFSSLAVHHLDDAQKAELFKDVFSMLVPGGALIIADLILPAGPQGNQYAANAYDDAVRRQAMEIDGHPRAFQQFEREQWNIFRYPDDPIDRPSRLFDQLKWLEAAGFEQVDVYWMRAGHAIFGGIRPGDQ